jgi:hypothetical protein
MDVRVFEVTEIGIKRLVDNKQVAILNSGIVH